MVPDALLVDALHVDAEVRRETAGKCRQMTDTHTHTHTYTLSVYKAQHNSEDSSQSCSMRL